MLKVNAVIDESEDFALNSAQFRSSYMSRNVVEDIYEATTTSAVDSPSMITGKSNSTSLHDIKELAWLRESITLNSTNIVYQVSLNTVSEP